MEARDRGGAGGGRRSGSSSTNKRLDPAGNTVHSFISNTGKLRKHRLTSHKVIKKKIRVKNCA